MSGYASQTKTMLQSASRSPTEIVHLPLQHHVESKPHLPTKRRRDSICGLGTFTKPFIIKPCPESPYDKPTTFKPIRIIGRSQLPLTFLDTSADSDLAPHRLFSASIDILEKQQDHQENEDGISIPKVLIARHETNKTLYAMERVQSCVFSLCRLAGWLKEKDMTDLWDPLRVHEYPALHGPHLPHVDGAQWWQHAIVQTEPSERPAKRAKLSMFRRSEDAVDTETTKEEVQPLEIEEILVLSETVQPRLLVADIADVPVDPPSPQQQLETLVQQYLDAVYLSKTSLAYFAKGPITRIRTAFTSPEEGAPQTYQLVTFLRSMLLGHKASDKKYRDKLPELIKTIPRGCFSDDELVAGPLKLRKTKKKLKMNREGVYPLEEDLVKRWWISEEPNLEVHGEENIEQRIKRRIGDLRVREALAQMMLMLEIIALEALSTYKVPSEEDQAADGAGETQEGPQTKPKKRKKKLEDVKLLLDLLLDKLCIWQSVDQDGILDFDSKLSKLDDGSNMSGKGGSSDRLQGFCVEVIIPFYVSRLPEQARMINKKLGGPIHTSPPKRKAVKPPITSRKPGEPKEPEGKKSRRTLGRVATDTTAQAMARKRTPSLHRSATDSHLLNHVKREESEVPLAAIPFQRSPSNAARQSLSQLKHLKGRQIDLSGPSAATAAKLQHKKRVEEDLQEAITALKKPNRGLAVGGYVDDLERRGLGSSNKTKKTGNASRKALKDIQVTATPRVGKRTKDILEQTPSRLRDPFIRENHGDSPPTSSFCIPSSGIRPAPSMLTGMVPRNVARQHIANSGIAETPTKGLVSKSFDGSGGVRRAIFATPAKKFASSPPENMKSTPGGIFATPIKNATMALVSQPSFTPPPAFATPLKAIPPAPAAAPDTPVPTLSHRPEDNQGQSIYDALGWNDDDDLGWNDDDDLY
ncbi:hypothetical protein K491DRAFT_695208 [Lophiostoma macrostomum CBS 122681]|uniref:DNA replication regulator Sld3 C-terminal domain-containing protein n=1 Tax=Lophiostoma macrostomum CBS 122681 TaxID=1314788 RepID=A0A6A6SYW4_9PLEO|nr:hypothetical protein K491DRAFT_695208 [Lophiostoma macrostomum CBS 122681]